MEKVSYHRHRFHPDIIKRAVWLYFRFTMSYRDVEELLAARHQLAPSMNAKTLTLIPNDDSLFRIFNSLIAEKNSLLICLGNLSSNEAFLWVTERRDR